MTWVDADFANLEREGIKEGNRTLTKNLKTVLEEVGMEKVQKHVNTQAKQAIRQAVGRMVKAAPEEVGEAVAKSKAASAIVIKHMVNTAPEMVGAEVAKDKVASAVVMEIILENSTDEELLQLERRLQAAKRKRGLDR